MLNEKDKNNYHVLRDYFFQNKYQTLMVDVENKTLYNRSLRNSLLRGIALGLTLIGIGLINPFLFILSPLVLFLYYLPIDNQNIREIAHNSLINKQIESIIAGDDTNECIDLQDKVSAEFGPIDPQVKNEIIEKKHEELFTQRIQLLENNQEEQENKLELAQQRLSDELGAPSFNLSSQFTINKTTILIKKQFTIENALAAANKGIDTLIGAEAAKGLRTAAAATKHMITSGPSKVNLWYCMAGLTLFATEQVRNNFSADEDLCSKISEYQEEQSRTSLSNP